MRVFRFNTMSEILRLTEQELKKEGIDYEIVSSKRHYKIRFEVAGIKHQIICSKTASDRRALLNARSLVRITIKRSLGEN